MQKTEIAKSYTALVLAVLFWGASYVGTKVALDGFPPLVLAFLRFLVAGLLFGALLLLKGSYKMPLRFHKRLFLLALFLPGLYFICENYGIKYTSATKASLIIATVPVAVAVLSALIRAEPFTRRRGASLVLSLAGVALLVFQGAQGHGGLFSLSRGDLLMVGAVFSSAVYMVMTRKLSEEYDTFVLTAYQMIYGLLFFTPFFLLEMGNSHWTAVTAEQWGALAVLAFFSTIGAFFAYNYALRAIPAGRASLFINVVPFVTAFCAWMLLGERLGSMQIGGGILVVLAACMASTTSKRQSVPQQTAVSANNAPE